MQATIRRAVPIAAIFPIAFVAILATGTPATGVASSSKSVVIKFFQYQPAKAKVAMGGSVDWTNQDAEGHTATADCCGTGAVLWDSGNLGQGQQYAFTFRSAGRYGYHCVYHIGMVGTVLVSPTASPSTGGLSTVFTITWSNGAVPKGFNADVQIKVPGADWADWKLDRTGRHVSASYTPTAGVGNYRFRARLQSTNTGDASDWSPAATITVA